jgi:methionyl-tRNA formyltransferase
MAPPRHEDDPPARVKALLSAVEDEAAEPGRVLDGRLLVACGQGAVRLLDVQREGKGVQDAETFLRGYPIPRGAQLG